MCYPKTGALMNNLVPGSLNITGSLTGTYSFNSGNRGIIRLTNTSTVAPGSANTSTLQLQALTGVRTIMLWFYVHSIPASNVNRYLLDARVGSTNGWIYSNSVDSIGSDFSGSQLYVNGTSQTLSWANIETSGSWRNVTIITPASFNDNITIFGFNANTNGMDVSFGPIMIYNRALTQTEVLQNYNYFAARFV
jgi:hypothetical protein